MIGYLFLSFLSTVFEIIEYKLHITDNCYDDFVIISLCTYGIINFCN